MESAEKEEDFTTDFMNDHGWEMGTIVAADDASPHARDQSLRLGFRMWDLKQEPEIISREGR